MMSIAEMKTVETLLPWETTMDQSAALVSVQSEMQSMFPATCAVESLNQSKKRPRRSMMAGSEISFIELFDAISADNGFPSIEWPADDDDDNRVVGRHRDNYCVAQSSRSNESLASSTSTTTQPSRRTKLRRLVNNKHSWSVNSLRTSKRIISGLCTLDSKKAQTQVDLQDYQAAKTFDGALCAALSFNQVLEAYRLVHETY